MRHKQLIYIVIIAICAFLAGCLGQGVKVFDTQDPYSMAEPEPPLKVNWTHQMAPKGEMLYGPIELAGLASDGNSVFVGSRQGVFYALDLITGNEIWSYKTMGPIMSTPVIDNHRVVFGNSDGLLYALRKADGGFLWDYSTKGEILGQPAVDENFLYFATTTNTINALDKVTGEWKWRFNRESVSGLTILGTSSPVIHDGIVYVGFSDGKIVALNAADGRERWQNTLEYEGRFIDVDSTVLIVDEKIYLASYDGSFFCLSVENGSILWKREGGGVSRPALAGDKVFFAGSDGQFYALNKDTGEKVWSIDITEQDMQAQLADILKPGRNSVAPVILDDKVVFGSQNGYLYFVEQVSGKIIWSYYPGTGIASEPVVKEGKLLFVSNTGNLYCLAPSKERTF